MHALGHRSQACLPTFILWKMKVNDQDTKDLSRIKEDLEKGGRGHLQIATPFLMGRSGGMMVLPTGTVNTERPWGEGLMDKRRGQLLGLHRLNVNTFENQKEM